MPIPAGSESSAGLATQSDVEARLGRALSESEAARLPSLLSDASALVIGWTGQDFEPAPYPDAVIGVTAGMVARAVNAATIGPVMPEQQSAGAFAVRYPAAATSGDVWLSASDKIKLRPYRRGGGLTSVQMVGERYNVTPTDPTVP